MHKKFFRLLPLLAAVLLSGCSGVLDPKGQIGMDEKRLIIIATVLMLLVVIPVIIMTLVFAWKYRATANATYTPNWSHSGKIEAVVWTIPIIIVSILGVITWQTSHELDPYRPLVHEARPVQIEVVSLDWKWLFIYPELGIATVNEIHFPTDVPVNFKLTSDTVMNAFFIPQLGSQIYTMAGMQTKLHLIANHAGVYDGLSTNYSGSGFSDMHFTATATSAEDFDAWVQKVRQSPQALSLDNFNKLALPTEKAPVEHYSSVAPELFRAVLNKYMGGDAHHGSDAAQEMGKQMHTAPRLEEGSEVNRGKTGEKGVEMQPGHDAHNNGAMKMDMPDQKHSDASMHGSGMDMSHSAHSGIQG